MKKKILTLGIVLALLVALVIPASVAMAGVEEGAVTCTVSGKLISVTVTDGIVLYGTLDLGTSANTVGTDLQTATNDGTVAEDFGIKSSDAVNGTTWALAGTAGADTFTHEFSIDAGTSWTIMTTSYQALATSIAVSGTETFDLRIGMPASVTDYGPKTITVTILATES